MDFLVPESQETYMDIQNEEPERRRGVKRGTKRGPYKRSGEEKARVLAAAQDGSGDWRVVAAANGVSASTAYGWLRRAEEPPAQRGGARWNKITSQEIDRLLGYLEENPQLTLKEMSRKLEVDTGIRVTTTTIHKHLHGRLYTCKKVRAEPATMNSEVNRQKRAEYVSSAVQALEEGKTLIYIDECNVNLFLRRTSGRSRKGARCSVKAPISKGKNVHVIGAISQTGLVYWERRRGSFTKDDCKDWLRRMLRASGQAMERLAVVCDNAPCHTGLEEVMDEEEFLGASLIRLGPYSAPLNPIEEVWSVMKASMKRLLAESMPGLLRDPVPHDRTQVEHRLQHLEGVIDAAVPVITPVLCLNACNHVQRHFAACLALAELSMGDNVV